MRQVFWQIPAASEASGYSEYRLARTGGFQCLHYCPGQDELSISWWQEWHHHLVILPKDLHTHLEFSGYGEMNEWMTYWMHERTGELMNEENEETYCKSLVSVITHKVWCDNYFIDYLWIRDLRIPWTLIFSDTEKSSSITTLARLDMPYTIKCPKSHSFLLDGLSGHSSRLSRG